MSKFLARGFFYSGFKSNWQINKIKDCCSIETVSAHLLEVIDQLNSLSREMRSAILDRQVERIGHISQSMVQNYMVQLLHHSKQFLACISGESDRMNFEQHLLTVYEAARAEIDNAKSYSVSPQVSKCLEGI